MLQPSTTLRHRKIYLLVGSPATGKTTFIRSLIYSKGVYKALVYDVNRETAYSKLPCVNVLKLGLYDVGKRRVIHNDPKQVIEYIIRDYHNGLLILDDVDRYLSPIMTQLQSLLVSHRHNGLDIVAVFHSLARVPPVFYETANTIILKKTTEKPERALYKLPNDDKVLSAYNTLLTDPDPYKTIVVVCR